MVHPTRQHNSPVPLVCTQFIAILNIHLTGAYAIWLYQLDDLSLHDIVMMAAFVIGISCLGLQPGPLHQWFAQPVNAILGSRESVPAHLRS